MWIHYDKTFAPIEKMTTIQTIIVLVANPILNRYFKWK